MHNSRTVAGALAAAVFFTTVSPCLANTRERYYDVRDRFSSERVIGPVTLHVIGINPFTDTVRWDTSSQDISPTDPSAILSTSALGKATSVASTAVAAAANGRANNNLTAGNLAASITPAQARANATLRSEAIFAKSDAAFVKTIQSAPQNTASAISQATLPANSELRSLQGSKTALLKAITTNPVKVAKSIKDALPALNSVTPTTPAGPNPEAVVALTAPAGCDDPLQTASLAACVAQLLDRTEQLRPALMRIRTSFRNLIVLSDAVLTKHRRVRNEQDRLAMSEDVRTCILDAKTPCDVKDDGNETFEKVDLKALIAEITNGHDAYRDVDRQYNRLNVAVAGEPDNSAASRVTAQLKIIRTILDRYNTVYTNLDGYSQRHLVPMTVADVGSNDVLMASGFEAKKVETCTGYANGGAWKPDVLNYVHSPVISMSTASSEPEPTAKPKEKTADAAADGATATPSPAPSETPAAADSALTEHDDVTVVCEAPLFLSLGFAADTLSGTSYASVGANTAGLPKPAAGATPVPSSIAASGRGIGPSEIQLANYALTEDDAGGGLAVSAGLGTNALFNSKARADVLAGISYAFARTLVLTTGVSFGPTTQLAPGYHTGGPITPGATVPTVSSYRAGAFLGLTFVTSAGVTPKSSPSPKPSESPSAKK